MPWEWDETLYAGSAPYYAAGRMPYPAEIAEALRTRLGLDGTGRLLDVGCGPGSLTLLLAPLFATAVGIDADPEMIAAARAADAAGRKVTWRCLRAEQLPADLGMVDVVTFAQSFHWFDRPRVAGAVRGMLLPGGAVVHVHATTHRGLAVAGRPYPPYAEIIELVRDYLGTVRRAGRGSLPGGTADGEDVVYRAAGFVEADRFAVGGGTVVERSADELVAATFSMSYAAPHLFGQRLPGFEGELRALLRTAAPEGRFAERTHETVATIWR